MGIQEQIQDDIARALTVFDDRDAFTSREVAEHIVLEWGEVDPKSDLMRIEGMAQKVRARLRRHTPEGIAEDLQDADRGTLDIFGESLQERYSVHRNDEQVYAKRETASDDELMDVAIQFERVGSALTLHADALRRYVRGR